MSDLTSEGERLVKNWLGAQQRVSQAEHELNQARCERSNTARELAKWLLPPDAKEGEKIAVWHGDSLIQAEVLSQGCDTRITIRKRGKSLSHV